MYRDFLYEFPVGMSLIDSDNPFANLQICKRILAIGFQIYISTYSDVVQWAEQSPLTFAQLTIWRWHCVMQWSVQTPLVFAQLITWHTDEFREMLRTDVWRSASHCAHISNTIWIKLRTYWLQLNFEPAMRPYPPSADSNDRGWGGGRGCPPPPSANSKDPYPRRGDNNRALGRR